MPGVIATDWALQTWSSWTSKRASKEPVMGRNCWLRWTWLLPALAALALPGVSAVAADRVVLAEEFTWNA